MKTILLTFFLTCFGVWAQTPDNSASDATDAAARDAIMRRALRAAIVADTNAAPVADTSSADLTAPAAATVNPGNAFPTLPAASPAFRRPLRPTPVVLTNSTPPLGGIVNNPAIAPLQPVPSNPVALANTPAKAPEVIIPAGDINFPAVNLDQVLQVYAELVGRTILHAQLPPIIISLKTQTPLTKTEAIQAFDSVLAMNNITMMNVGDKFVKAVPVNLAYQQAAPFSTNDESMLAESDQYITHIAQLRYAKPTEVVPILTPLSQIPNSILAIDSSQMLIIRDYSANVKRMLELIKQIDVTVPLEYDSEVIAIKYAQASDIASALSTLGSGSGTTIGHGGTTGGGGSRTGGLGSSMGGGMGNPGGGYNGTPGMQGNQPGGLNQPGTMGSAGGNGRSSSFGDRLNSIVRKAAAQGEFQVLGQTKIIADQRTNSLLVFASKQDMEMIKKIISQLDIVLAQVLIEAIIMEVTLENGRNLGVSYIQNQASTPGHYFSGQGGINNGTLLNGGSFNAVGTNGSPSIPSGLSYFANFGGDFSATLTAIADDSRINVLSRPRIQTSHGVAASLQVGDTVPEVTGTYFNGIGGGGSSSQYQQTFVGINLQVTPLINPDGLVVMDIVQDIQQLGNNVIIDGNPVPTTSKRTAQATVSVRDRDTIILGGMISTSKSTSHSGVPFLKDIPGLGYLFRSSIDSGKRVELIVMIRPTVLPTPESAALVTAHERDKMPGIKAAERENRLEENRRLKESDKIKVPKERD